MRKMLAVAAALMISAAAIVPAQAATAGQRCTTKLAIAKSGTAKLYCGKNTNAKTAKQRPLVWKRNAMCYDGMVVVRENAASVTETQKQLDELNAQIAALPAGPSTEVMRTSLVELSNQLTMGLKDLQVGQKQLRTQLVSYCK